MASNEGQNSGQNQGPGRPENAGQHPPRPDDDGGRSVAKFFGLGFQFAAAIVVAVVIGQWVDGRYGTDPWGVLGGAFLGFGAGFFSIYRTVMAAQRSEAGKKTPGRQTPDRHDRTPKAGA